MVDINDIKVILIGSEIMKVTFDDANGTLTVERGKLQTVAQTHLISTKVFTIQYFTTTNDYNYSETTDLNQSDLFSVSIDGGKITLNSLSQYWNNFSSTKLYNFKQNKPVFIFEGTNTQIIKTYEGLTSGKSTNSRSKNVQIDFKNPINKYFNESIATSKVYNDKTIEFVLEDKEGKK